MKYEYGIVLLPPVKLHSYTMGEMDSPIHLAQIIPDSFNSSHNAPTHTLFINKIRTTHKAG